VPSINLFMRRTMLTRGPRNMGKDINSRIK
jgi:hypothetical protein